jgi:L-cysteate sulfo-lyase
MITSVPLGTWPTPVEEAPRLAARLGLAALWFKRDDLCGPGGGGNKVRKLEFLLGEAVAAGARTVITSGGPQSNHARLTAAAAARLGLRCVLVLAGDPPAAAGGNLLLDELAGADVRWAGDRPLASAVEQERGDAFVIPFGGSSAVSVEGYVRCGRELRDQIGDFDSVVVPLGSGGTMAGLVRELGPSRVVGVDVGALPDPAAAVRGLLGDESLDLRVDRSQIGAGYPALTEPVRQALQLTARLEGVFLDPTYTGRAMASLIAGGHGSRVVFLHSGGVPALFAHPAW